MKQIGPLTPQQQQQTFGLRNFHHHHDTLDKSKAIYNGAKTVLEKIDRMANWPKIIGLRELAHLIWHQEQQTFIIIETLLISQKPFTMGPKYA